MAGRLVPRGLLRVEKARSSGTWTLYLKGEVDLSNVHRVEREMRSLESADGHTGIILDLSELEFIDSAGIAWLVREMQRAETDGDRLRVRGTTANVRRVLDLTGVDDQLPYVD